MKSRKIEENRTDESTERELEKGVKNLNIMTVVINTFRFENIIFFPKKCQ